MSTNASLAKILLEIADLLDLAGEKFKPDAYRRAARSIESLTEDVRAVAGRGELDEIPGVGVAISEKIREFLRTGSIEYYERTRRASPPGLLEIMRLPGIGPKTARRFWIELGVEGPIELRQAILAGRLVGLRGFGPKKIALIEKALTEAGPPARRTPLSEAWVLAERIVTALRATAPIERIEVAGSLRRRREDVGDIDILVTSGAPEAVFDAFSALPERREIRLRGPTKETILFGEGIQVDLRVLEPASFGAALQYFTGSKDHNVRLRSLARDAGLKINEYGVFRGEERVAGATEEEVYATLGLPYIPPEIRENQGEIEAATAQQLPRLVELGDLRGDLHLHLDGSDPAVAVADLSTWLRSTGWEYAGVVLPGEMAASDPAVRLLRSGTGPRVLLAQEVEVADLGSPVPAGIDYRIVRAGRAAPPAELVPGSGSVRHLVVGHWESNDGAGRAGPDQVGPWIRWAREHGIAIDVQPSEALGGADSTTVHRTIETAGRIHISRDRALDGSGILSLGTARRGWASADRVLNASTTAGLKVPPRPGR